MPTLLDPAEVRASQIQVVDIGGDQVVHARRLDLTMMLFEGLLPQPIMAAAQRLVEARQLGTSAMLEALDETDKAAQLEALRQYAVTVVVEPVVVRHDDHNPAHLCVELLTMPQLLAIWNQTAVRPKVSAAQAAEFRRDPVGGTPPAARARQDVRPPAQSVAEPDFRSA